VCVRVRVCVHIRADILTRNMRQDGWAALAIHGDKQQVCLNP
jgi:superfamily II DNA/RNA helicase